MFLLTFAMVVISMLSIYTQVYALEVARLLAGQSGIAQTMLIWHNAAVSLASNVVNRTTLPVTATGCMLSPVAWGGVPLCKTGLGVGLPSGPGVAATADVAPGTYVVGGNSYPQHPVGYNTTNYQWNSIAFQIGSYYVVTFVSAPPGGTISTAATGANALNLNMTESDLFRQFQNLRLPGFSFGYVTNSGGVAKLNVGNAVTPFTVPASIPDGAFAIITYADQCVGC